MPNKAKVQSAEFPSRLPHRNLLVSLLSAGYESHGPRRVAEESPAPAAVLYHARSLLQITSRLHVQDGLPSMNPPLQLKYNGVQLTNSESIASRAANTAPLDTSVMHTRVRLMTRGHAMATLLNGWAHESPDSRVGLRQAQNKNQTFFLSHLEAVNRRSFQCKTTWRFPAYGHMFQLHSWGPNT